MKNTIINLVVVTALSFSGAALAAGETGSKAQPPAAAKPATPASVTPPPASAVPTTTTAGSAPSAQASQPAAKPSTPEEHATTKPARPKNLDLRHCLDLEGNTAIAKCAGE